MITVLVTEQFLPKVKIICDVTFKKFSSVWVPKCHWNGLHLDANLPSKWPLFRYQFATKMTSVWVPIRTEMVFVWTQICHRNSLCMSKYQFATEMVFIWMVLIEWLKILHASFCGQNSPWSLFRLPFAAATASTVSKDWALFHLPSAAAVILLSRNSVHVTDETTSTHGLCSVNKLAFHI